MTPLLPSNLVTLGDKGILETKMRKVQVLSNVVMEKKTDYFPIHFSLQAEFSIVPGQTCTAFQNRATIKKKKKFM